jgi:hypothetical protein
MSELTEEHAATVMQLTTSHQESVRALELQHRVELRTVEDALAAREAAAVAKHEAAVKQHAGELRTLADAHSRRMADTAAKHGAAMRAAADAHSAALGDANRRVGELEKRLADVAASYAARLARCKKAARDLLSHAQQQYSMGIRQIFARASGMVGGGGLVALPLHFCIIFMHGVFQPCASLLTYISISVPISANNLRPS